MNFKELKDFLRLTTLIEATNVTDANINTLINQGYHELSVEFAWPWLETSVDFTVSPDVRNYALPSNFDYAITLIDTNTDRSIPHVAAQAFFQLVGQDSSSTRTAASFWTIYDGDVYFHPVPSTATTAAYTMKYYKNITTLSGDQDEPAFHDGFHWMLVEYAKWKLWDREEYHDQSERAFITYSRYLKNMVSWYGSPVKRVPFLWGGGRPVRRFNNLTILDI